MNNFLAQLETKLQNLIEQTASRLFNDRNIHEVIAWQLVQALDANVVSMPDGRRVAPNQFTITASSTLAYRLDLHLSLIERLADLLEESGHEAGYYFLTHPQVTIQGDTKLWGEELRITAKQVETEIAETNEMPAVARQLAKSGLFSQ